MGKPSFIGRSAELQQIKDLWKKACEGRPQVVNLVADTGAGKTRLVQAFYEWLSIYPEHSDGICSQNYWPNDLGVGRQRVVNPPLERFASFDLNNDRIPWLWWGMYWTDADGENECGLVRFHDYIDVHLSMLELQRNAFSKSLADVRDTVRNEAFGFVAGLIPGGSQARSVFDLAKKLQANRKEHKEAQKGLASQDKNRQEALAESIVERLRLVFNSKKKSSPPIPLVLFLDDIHFATDISRDGFSLQFLDRLMRQAGREQWPLLVLTTHWKGPWQLHRKGVNLEEGKPWRRIMLELDVEQNIKTPDIHTLKLHNIPREELRSVILDYLPGLNREDQDKLLALVDNVRWLVEVLNALSDSAENFEDNDRARSLSAHGHRRLDKLLKTRGYMEVIRQRLEGDAMRDFRAVLGATAWHAHELEFISPLASAFGLQLVEQGALPAREGEPGQQVLEILLRALDPSALLEGQGKENCLPSLVRFPERGYLEIAKELFDTEYLPALRLALGQEVIFWMQNQNVTPRWKQLEEPRQQKAFLEIALAVLKQLQPQLGDKQREELDVTEKSLRRRLEKGKITEEELLEELNEAKQELLGESKEKQLYDAAQWHAVAMLELINILDEEGNGRAWLLAHELAEHPQLMVVLKSLNFTTSISLALLWKEKTDCWPQTRNLLASLIQDQKNLLSEENTRESLNRLAIALEILADLETAAGDISQAKACYRHSVLIRERVLAEYGDTPDSLSDLSHPIGCLALLNWSTGELEYAREGYLRSLEINEQLLENVAYTMDSIQPLTQTLLSLAHIDWETGERDRALLNFKRSFALFEQQIFDVGELPSDLERFGAFLMSVANAYQTIGAYDQARAHYQQSQAIIGRLLTEFGETPFRLYSFNITCDMVAYLDKVCGSIDQARAGYLKSLCAWERFITEFGETPERLRCLTAPLLCLADLDQTAGATDQARAAYNRSLLILERLLAEYEETPERLSRLAYTLQKLADLDQASGLTDQAKSGYERCVGIHKRLLEELGDSPQRLKDLTTTLQGLERLTIALNKQADSEKAAGSTDQARTGYQSALATWEHLLSDFGDTVVRLRGLAVSLERLADLDRASDNISLAQEGYQRSLAIWEHLLGEFGETVDRLRGLTIPIERLAALNRTGGDFDQSRVGYQRSLAIRELLIAKPGSPASCLTDLANTLYRLADLNQAAGEAEQARAEYKRCLAIRESLLAESSENPKLFKSLASPLLRLADLDRAAGNIGQARAGYQRSVEVWECLLEKFGETPEYLRNLTISLERLAYQHRSEGSFGMARDNYQRCLAIRERLLADFGETPQRLIDLVKTLEYLANLYQEVGYVDRARASYQHSLILQKRLLIEQGESHERLCTIAKTQKRLATLDLTTDDPQ